ncbi:hypothetical protein JCM5296_003679 [Sporobolomyces johnsonii]
MPLFLRSSSSKRNLAAARATPAPPPPLPSATTGSSGLGSPFQLQVPFAAATASSSSASSDSVSSRSNSTDANKSSSPTESQWSVVQDSPNTAAGGEDLSPRKKRSASFGSNRLGTLFRRRSSKNLAAHASADQLAKVEVVPPLPKLPPTLGLFELPNVGAAAGVEQKVNLADSRMNNDSGVLTPPAEPGQESEDLASLLYLVHAAGDKFSAPERVPSVPYSVPPVSSSPTPDETPPLVSSSAFSSPSSNGSRSPGTPHAPYAFLSHLASRDSLLSPHSQASTLLTPPTTPPLPPGTTGPERDGGESEEDDYGGSSDGESAAPLSVWQQRPNSSFRKASSSAQSPRPGSLALPPPAPRAPGPRGRSNGRLPSPRRRPLGPRATHLLEATVGRLSPAPSTPEGAHLAAPLSTHPSSAVRATANLRQPQSLRLTLGRLALLRKLKRGTTMLEAMEIERRPPAPVAPATKAGSRLSVLSAAGTEASEGDDRDGDGRTSLDTWELEHGDLEDDETVRRVLGGAGGGGGGGGEKDLAPFSTLPAAAKTDKAFSLAASDAAAPGVNGARPTPLGKVAAVFPRLRLWIDRPGFADSHLVVIAVEDGVLMDLVRRRRTGFGQDEKVAPSARLRGMLDLVDPEPASRSSIEGIGSRVGRPAREGRDKGGREALGGEVFSAAMRHAAAGATQPPPPFQPPVRSFGGARKKKLLLPGPLLLQALAEEPRHAHFALPTPTATATESSDEDDLPLASLKRSPTPVTSPSPMSAAALLQAQQKAARLENEVARLRAREIEAREREVRILLEQEEREDAREQEIRENEIQRRMAEQRRRSKVMHTKIEPQVREPQERRPASRRSSTMPLPRPLSGMIPTSQSQQLLAVPTAWGMPTLAVPVAVPVPLYQTPRFSISAPALPHSHSSPMLYQPLRDPSPLPPPPPLPIPRSASRQQQLHVASPPRRRATSPGLPPAAAALPASPPPRRPSPSPRRASFIPPANPPPPSRRLSTVPVPSPPAPAPAPRVLPHSKSTPALGSRRLSTQQPFIQAVEPPAAWRFHQGQAPAVSGRKTGTGKANFLGTHSHA